MNYRVKINTENGGLSEKLRGIVPSLQSRFPSVPFEVVASRVPEVERYPKTTVIYTGDGNREWISAVLYGFRSEAGIVNFLSAILEEEWSCEVKR